LNLRWEIPAGDSNYNVKASYVVPEDAEAISILPHMHLLGKSMEVTAVRPDGSKEALVLVPKYDFNWQRTYVFKTPVDLPKGTRIEVSAIYDNSIANRNNPNSPPKPVRWGEATTDEMFVAYIQFVTR